jgi:hypothetical protein
VCQRWNESLAVFVADMGEPAPGMTLERIDNNRDYEPENCRWASRKDQARNTRNNRMMEFQGRTQCLAAWAEEFGISLKCLWRRLSEGWTLHDALTTPVRIVAYRGHSF